MEYIICFIKRKVKILIFWYNNRNVNKILAKITAAL